MQKHMIILLVVMLAIKLGAAQFRSNMKYVNQPTLTFASNGELKSKEKQSSSSSAVQEDYYEPPPDSQDMEPPTTYSQEGLPPPKKPLPDTPYNPQYELPLLISDPEFPDPEVDAIPMGVFNN